MRPALACLSLLCMLGISVHHESLSLQIGETVHVFHLLSEQRPVAATAVGSGAASIDAAALQEMLRGSNAQPEHWDRVPELMVLMSVMEYHRGEPTSYAATSEQLTDQEADELTRELTAALVLLTGGTYHQFAAIRRESVAAGASISVLRPKQIVVGRYREVQNLVHTLGLGGRAARVDGTITGAAIILDNEYDRTSPKRRLLRTHELGHALGYNHVQSQISIMNERIGPEPTDFDREAAKVAFRTPLTGSSN